MDMDKLPIHIIHRILEYDGKMKYRNGKYMNQILSNDKRYDMLLKRASKSFEKKIIENGHIIYKTRVELTKFTLLCIQNHPLWYNKTYLVCKCRKSKIYTKMHCLI